MMSTPVMLVLSALMVTMVTCHGTEADEPASNYPTGGMKGKWYIVGYATNGSWTGYTPNANTAVYVATWTLAGQDNGLKFTFSEQNADSTTCQNTTRDLEKKSKGVWEYEITGNPDRHFEVVVTNFTVATTSTFGYAVIHIAEGDEDGDHEDVHPCINLLYSRTAIAAPDDVMSKFAQLSWSDDDIPQSKVHRLANNGEC